MRTIEHQGATDPYDFTVIAPNEYTFVFSPNQLKITLGSGYATTQEVSISANGITHTRNAINRVVYFDLSVIFKSWFDDDNFVIPSAASTLDPFFKDTFNVVVTADSDTEDIPFRLRWGAEQFDKRIAYTDFEFPFWEGYPICVGAGVDYTSYVLTHGATVVNGSAVDLYPFAPTQDFTFEAIKGGDSRTVTYRKQCALVGNYLRWIDDMGQVWQYMFNKNTRVHVTSVIKTGDRIKSYPLNVDDSEAGREKIISKQKDRSFTCFTSCDEDIFPIIETVVSSPMVWWWDGTIWIAVNVSDASISQVGNWLNDIEFTVELPTDFTQQR